MHLTAQDRIYKLIVLGCGSAPAGSVGILCPGLCCLHINKLQDAVLAGPGMRQAVDDENFVAATLCGIDGSDEIVHAEAFELENIEIKEVSIFPR